MADSKRRRKEEQATSKAVDLGDSDSERKVDPLKSDGEDKKTPEYPPVSFLQMFR